MAIEEQISVRSIMGLNNCQHIKEYEALVHTRTPRVIEAS
ncbi:helicase [Salmonella phage 18-India]|nr:helicase [Salmonella phage 18-India]